VTIFEDGRPVEKLTPEEARMVAKFLANWKEVEICHDDGTPVAKLVPGPIVPWEPTVTKEDLDRRSAAGGGMSLADFWKRMGVE
jgi:antitoxin (DNA-binding transcriptional repressor) of toxin-antitoxin stability system